MSIKVSYAYCEWSDREEIRNRIKNLEQEELKNEEMKKEKEHGNSTS